MRTYQCHKKVQADKITHLLHTLDLKYVMVCLLSGYQITVSLEWFEKHEPQEGGYLVKYADGYLSYSPAKAFEEGYSLA